MKAPTRWQLFVLWLYERRYAFFERLQSRLERWLGQDFRYSDWWERVEHLAGHTCGEEDCNEVGMPCFIGFFFANDGEWSDTQPATYYCGKHAKANGFCYGCGQFSAGIESFDFGGGLCDDCRASEGFDDDEDDDYDDDDPWDG